MGLELGRLGIIRHFFESGPHGRKVEMAEMKALTPEDKDELGPAAVEALGAEKLPSGKWLVPDEVPAAA